MQVPLSWSAATCECMNTFAVCCAQTWPAPCSASVGQRIVSAGSCRHGAVHACLCRSLLCVHEQHGGRRSGGEGSACIQHWCQERTTKRRPARACCLCRTSDCMQTGCIQSFEGMLVVQDLEEKCSKDFWTTTAIEMVVWPPYQVPAHHLQRLAPPYTSKGTI